LAVNSDDLLAVAALLESIDGEAPHRAAASRYYYAAFLHLRKRLVEIGAIQSSQSRFDHMRVERALGTWNPSAQPWFHYLRNLRNNADYDCDEDFNPASLAVARRITERLLAI
jgi:hypothetical protein